MKEEEFLVEQNKLKEGSFVKGFLLWGLLKQVMKYLSHKPNVVAEW
jgi:hypothetical protein